MQKTVLMYLVMICLLVWGMRQQMEASEITAPVAGAAGPVKVNLSKLTPMQYNVTQNKATEPAFANEFWNNHEAGGYNCVVCGEQLFVSDNKFDSGCGWPAFSKPVKKESITTCDDRSFGIIRTEVICKHCGAHLGHVFKDGPAPGGTRYCINSASLSFLKKTNRNAGQSASPAESSKATNATKIGK